LNRNTKFMKHISMRTVRVAGHRFIFGMQRDWDDIKADGEQFGSESVSARLHHTQNWGFIEKRLEEIAVNVGLSTSWISEKDQLAWKPSIGKPELNKEHCNKEQLDQVLQSVVERSRVPAVLLDPFLPECPVIAVNAAAQKLTGWTETSSTTAASADRVLEEVDYSGGGGGAYYLNYGAYDHDQTDERLAVQAACANGRPVTAMFRDMYEQSNPEKPVYMRLQGMTVGQGSGPGPLNGEPIWYLVGLLGNTGTDPEDWEQSKEMKNGWANLRTSLEIATQTPEVIRDMNMPPINHPMGGRVVLASQAVWHNAAARSKPPSPPRRPLDGGYFGARGTNADSRLDRRIGMPPGSPSRLTGNLSPKAASKSQPSPKAISPVSRRPINFNQR